MKITDERRNKMIARLEQDKADVVYSWALKDWDSFTAYIAEVEDLDSLDDSALTDIYESTFDNPPECGHNGFSPDCESCEDLRLH